MKLNFAMHIKEKISKTMKGINIIKKLSNVLPRKSLITISKFFLMSHLDYSDFIYDNERFRQHIQSVKNNACLAITGVSRNI